MRRSIQLPIDDARDHQLAEHIITSIARPAFAMSAMDGYAVRLKDVSQPGKKLQVIGEAPAGRPFEGAVDQDQAVRIFTGGIIPAGCDHVIVQENTARTGKFVISNKAEHAPNNIRKAGIDFESGDTILTAGKRLDAYAAALAASANIAVLPVWDKLNVALLASGDELKQPGSKLEKGDVLNANSAAVKVLISEWGSRVRELPIVKDNLPSIQRNIAEAGAEIDVFVAIGGASVGDHDHMRSAFVGAGFELIFDKVAMRPGKPTWFAKRQQQYVLGLPGNPASALVSAHIFLKPLLYADEALLWTRARTASELAQNGPREHYIRAKAWIDESALLWVSAIPDQDSSLLTPFSEANCLLRRPSKDEAIAKGDLVEMLILKSLQ